MVLHQRMEKSTNIFQKSENINGNCILDLLTAEPGFIGVAPGRGVITCPPVSVCQNVSTIEHLLLPTVL